MKQDWGRPNKFHMFYYGDTRPYYTTGHAQIRFKAPNFQDSLSHYLEWYHD